jgi:hypothetical protein
MDRQFVEDFEESDDDIEDVGGEETSSDEELPTASKKGEKAADKKRKRARVEIEYEMETETGERQKQKV